MSPKEVQDISVRACFYKQGKSQPKHQCLNLHFKISISLIFFAMIQFGACCSTNRQRQWKQLSGPRNSLFVSCILISFSSLHNIILNAFCLPLVLCRLLLPLIQIYHVFDKYLMTELGAGSTKNNSYSNSPNLVKECAESNAPCIQFELSISTRSFQNNYDVGKRKLYL